jgi:hypothetical protein
MPSTSASHAADTVVLTIRIPRMVYDALVIWLDETDGSVEGFAASLVG